MPKGTWEFLVQPWEMGQNGSLQSLLAQTVPIWRSDLKLRMGDSPRMCAADFFVILVILLAKRGRLDENELNEH